MCSNILLSRLLGVAEDQIVYTDLTLFFSCHIVLLNKLLDLGEYVTDSYYDFSLNHGKRNTEHKHHS